MYLAEVCFTVEVLNFLQLMLVIISLKNANIYFIFLKEECVCVCVCACAYACVWVYSNTYLIYQTSGVREYCVKNFFFVYFHILCD